MALKVNFYGEIFSQEQKWIELINAGLLNSIYCNLTLKPFYEKKREELERLFGSADNKILQQILNIIDAILAKLNDFDVRYRNMESADIKELIPLFLVSKMGNNVFSSTDEEKEEISSYRKL